MGQEAVRDFPRPKALTPAHLQRLRTMHEVLADDFRAALSSLLRSPVDVSLTDVDQLTYGEFVCGLQTPTCFNLLRADPLEDRLMLDIEPSILYPMMDRLLGGGCEDGPPPSRPLSDIELPLAVRVTRLFLQQLRRVWKNTVDLKLEVLRVESDPRPLRVLPSDEAVVLVGFQLTIGDRRGMMRLCLPCRAVQRLDGKASLVEVEVALATTPVAAGDLRSLCIGDVIVTETGVGSPAVVSMAGEAKFHAQPGVCQGRKVVRITGIIENFHPSDKARTCHKNVTSD